MSEIYSLYRGDAPLLISIPHLGTQIPEPLRAQYSDAALTLVDTDWHLDRLYAFAAERGATVLGARISRYVIDLNGRTAAPSGFTWVANGRFKGGYITRHFGAPQRGIHAVQLEMCQSTYTDEHAPFAYAPELASKVEPVLRDMVGGALGAVTALTDAGRLGH